jgi:hypothetical protein
MMPGMPLYEYEPYHPGAFNQNFDLYTVMTYNKLKDMENPPALPNPNQGLKVQNLPDGFMAFDIAVLRYLYPPPETSLEDKKTYHYFIDGGGNKCIWDETATNVIAFAGDDKNVVHIDLRPATLGVTEQTNGIGGFVSSLSDGDKLISAITIAQGATIDGAIGGPQNDTFQSYDRVSNLIHGGKGIDRVYYSSNYDDYEIKITRAQAQFPWKSELDLYVEIPDGIQIFERDAIQVINGSLKVFVQDGPKKIDTTSYKMSIHGDPENMGKEIFIKILQWNVLVKNSDHGGERPLVTDVLTNIESLEFKDAEFSLIEEGDTAHTTLKFSTQSIEYKNDLPNQRMRISINRPSEISLTSKTHKKSLCEEMNNDETEEYNVSVLIEKEDLRTFGKKEEWKALGDLLKFKL